ncbi:MAG: penicillin-binding transpeptidase domain-containing protein [Candidatus Nanopelagicales bacterium]|nr:penicillin-binding transpeptidase domain-containing protein [Candidatus Nanopelagicales bacterium]
MNRPIRRVAAVLAVLLIALIANVTVIQVFRASDYRDRPGNQRQLLEQYDRERGPILVAADPAARSVDTGDTLRYQRVYSNGPLYAPITGFYSLVYGATGLERTENKILNGSSDLLFVDRTKQLFAGRQIQGGAVSTTIDPLAQVAAFTGLGAKTGSVVAIEPSTGRILASAQSPSFDPNLLSTHKPADIREYYAKLTADPDKPLLNRPIVALNPPGSTFKLVVTAAALASGEYTSDSLLPGPKTYQLPNSTKRINNWNRKACSASGVITLRDALAISCNTAFAWLGNQLGADALRTQAQLMGFDTRFEIPLRAARSTFPEDPDAPQTSLSAIGQFDVRATALQMAMVASAVANRGVLMNPYMVQEVRGPDLAVLQTTTPTIFKQAMTAANAASETEMMVNVVNNGTGSNARIPGVEVAGKTGTAQTGNDRPSVAWFVAFAPAKNPKVAVAVCIEEAGTAEISGNGLAAPIARKVIQAVLRQS